MSNHNPNDRIYMRSNKPANEMTDEEIRAFAEEMYEQIMSQMSADKKTDESWFNPSKNTGLKIFLVPT